jgi:orotidine-5'-phosphate decarboxylase
VSEHFADRLLEASAAKAPVCVGIDPVFEQLPPELKKSADGEDGKVRAIGGYCRQLLEVVAPIVPAVKPQIAYFEVYRDKGMALYYELVRLARQIGLLVIGDVKRGDIGPTAAAYAAGHLGHSCAPDAVTVNGYFGDDGIEPFIAASGPDGGVFVLVRTSNPSAAAIQDFKDAAGLCFYEHLALRLADLDKRLGRVGACGYSNVGAVVGATYPAQAERLRQILPRQIFLVPGYGAQGASSLDCAAAFKPDGTGAVVNASRSVIYAYNKGPYAGKEWKKAVESAAKDFVADINGVLRR